jgi:hypothetical protein
LENVLRRIGVGLQTNPTTTSSDLLIFCHFLIETHMAARVQAAAAANDSRSTVGAIGSAPLVGKKSKKEYVLFGDKPKSTVEKPLLHTAPTVARRSREEALAVIPSARVAAAAAAEANIQARKLNDDAVVIFALQLLLSSFKRNRLGSSNLPANMQVIFFYQWFRFALDHQLFDLCIVFFSCPCWIPSSVNALLACASRRRPWFILWRCAV